MQAWEFLRGINETCHFMSRYGKGKASNSELKRWLQNKSVVVNGERPNWDDQITFPVTSMVLFPKRNRVTLV